MLISAKISHQTNFFGSGLSTAKTNIITGVVSHNNHALPEVLTHIEISRGNSASDCVCDGDYRGRNFAIIG